MTPRAGWGLFWLRTEGAFGSRRYHGVRRFRGPFFLSAHPPPHSSRFREPPVFIDFLSDSRFEGEVVWIIPGFVVHRILHSFAPSETSASLCEQSRLGVSCPGYFFVFPSLFAGIPCCGPLSFSFFFIRPLARLPSVL